ncbi:XisH family protein [Planktothricoides raciborskii]|uniref:XisH family protein n=3 Tax=Planktothricoides TaxID=132607 RepID=A0AAU8JCZ7_9CYAN|nr:XisH family protein [Planktothricoides raciborskii]
MHPLPLHPTPYTLHPTPQPTTKESLPNNQQQFMPTKDIFHNAVKNALIKDGWTITDDPLYLDYGGIDMYVDLGAEKIIAAEKLSEKGTEKIAVEIKSFVHPSMTYEFHTALGHYLNYRLALDDIQPERKLYLAISEETYETFFILPFTQNFVNKNQIYLLIYDSNQEVIKQWKNCQNTEN